MRSNGAWVRQFLGLGMIAISCVAIGSTARAAHSPLAEGAVVISEFFDEIQLVNMEAGTVVDVLNSDPFNSPFGQHLEALDANSIALTSFSELHRYDVATRQVSLVRDLSFNPREITRDGTGHLYAVGSPGLVHVDATTGAETVVFDNVFFSPSDAVVDAAGLVYLTDFFAGLGVVDPTAGTFRKIGDFSANQFAHLDLGPDGWLYAATTFGGEFYRIHPSSGAATQLAADASIGVEDLQVAADGTLVIGGRRNSIDGVHTIDPTTGVITTVVNGSTLNGGFFNVLDLDLYESNLRASVPEPGGWTLFLGGIGTVLALLQPRRRAGR